MFTDFTARLSLAPGRAVGVTAAQTRPQGEKAARGERLGHPLTSEEPAIDLPSGTWVVGLRGSQERQAGQRAREGVRAEPVP